MLNITIQISSHHDEESTNHRIVPVQHETAITHSRRRLAQNLEAVAAAKMQQLCARQQEVAAQHSQQLHCLEQTTDDKLEFENIWERSVPDRRCMVFRSHWNRALKLAFAS